MSQPLTTATVELMAPLTGVLVPLDQVPDPVFAKKMVGDGFSIDPLHGLLVAPVAGEVVDLQPSHHAITIRTAEGLEILMHIGLDTVALGGEGFTPRVTEGASVAPGDPLIEFDLDGVGRAAKSLLTQVVITNMEIVESIAPSAGMVDAGSSVAAYVQLKAQDEADGQPKQGATVTSQALIIPNPTGLHARPTATLVNLAKQYSSDVRIRRGDDTANAKSIVAIMGMAVARGDKVTVTAHGSDAAEAVDAIVAAIREGLGEAVPASGTDDTVAMPAVPAESAPAPAPLRAAPEPRSGDPDLLLGVAASPGLGVGTVVQVRHDDIAVSETGEDHHKERRKLNSAIDRAALDLSALELKLERDGSADKAAIFAAHGEILQDPELLDIAVSAIDKGKSAPFAWRAAYNSFADQLAGLDNEVLAGRAADVRDVGQRVLEELTGQRSEKAELPEAAILVAEELTPSDTAQLDRSRVVGFATTGGGASSHVAIIARSFGIPAVAGIEPGALDIVDGSRVVLDGTAGTLRQNLSDTEIDEILARQRRMAERRERELAAKDQPAVTTDGHAVQVVANIGGADDAAQSVTMGGEGVGLLRSEFVFLGRTTAPTEAEQADVYAACAKALRPGDPLVIRTLDVGGDKPLAYVPIPVEENPFLGIRGVRVGLEQPELLRTQLRAILAAAGAGAELHIMFPMIATIADWRAAKAIYDEVAEDHPTSAHVSVGIMMEVPSVAVMAEQFAAEEGCDFFSVGTNDLTSYTLAMDRGHPKLASQVDPCNPAVLKLIGDAAEALHRHGKWLGICGGVASDVQAVPILLGLGVDELSCSIPAIPAVKAAVRAVSIAHCREIAARAVTCATPEDVRALVPATED
ncbi:phosphoenolpyruvate--protein phosphotransferase [Tessaracoccus palaemonis]|uniref:Phosphocarrier protein HPr n=1 Tax=Tessaracoccus palaemonis TaxID=2829499 RepID=A0ABX8SNK5_9ACTN|nr:phosphoenolpyruvate--protein phosphotransferase [Tessaracoccus palaemonis]QXT63768.1 phosphoenolpyruvate--protein phosphotransferase [Tessaracoccus palaemonis]